MAIKIQRKAQISIFTRPIMIIVLISIFAMFVIKTMQVNVYISNEVENYNFKVKSSYMVDGIIKCINDDSTSYPYLVDADKLDDLARDFVNGEPPCMRDERAGWNAVVKDIESPTEKSWEFGEHELSAGKALTREYGLAMPVAIKYEDGAVNPGTIYFNIVQGDLESIVGRIESVYKIGYETRKAITAMITIRLDYPLFMHVKNGKKQMCLEIDGENVCKTLVIENLRFNKIEPGMHYITIRYDPRENYIIVRD